MQQLLIINPNTSANVTAKVLDHACAMVGPGVRVRAITARFGAPYISCEASYAVAAHATLDAWACDLAHNTPAAHAILIGCFGDPALLAMQQTSAAAVTGLAEAAFVQASKFGKYAIVTGGERWKPMLWRLADALGCGDALTGIHTVAPSGVQLAQDPAGAQRLLEQACLEALALFSPDALILGGAALAGMAAAIQHCIPVPVIDSVSAGVQHALAMLGKSQLRGNNQVGFAWQQVSPELQAIGLPATPD